MKLEQRVFQDTKPAMFMQFYSQYIEGGSHDALIHCNSLQEKKRKEKKVVYSSLETSHNSMVFHHLNYVFFSYF